MFEHRHFRLTRHVISLKFQRFKKYYIISMMFPIGFDVCIRKNQQNKFYQIRVNEKICI